MHAQFSYYLEDILTYYRYVLLPLQWKGTWAPCTLHELFIMQYLHVVISAISYSLRKGIYNTEAKRRMHSIRIYAWYS